MRKVLDASERRKLEVIEHLYFTESWVTLKELALKTVSSERILKQDMLQLREYYTKEVLQTSHLGVRLVLPPYKDCDDLYRYFLSNSLAFNFIEMLIYDETKTVFELAEELYVSPSTLFRLIKKLNISLTDYYVQVQTNPCKLISETEESIRYFYISYFSERYNNLEWPFKTINQNFFEQLLIFIAKTNNIPVNFADFKRLKLWTAVPYLRVKQGHQVSVMSSNYSKMIPDFSNFQPLTGLIEKKLAITLDKNFIEQVFSIFINNDFKFSYESLIEDTKINPAVKERVSYHTTLLHNLSNQIGIPIPNQQHLLKEMFNISHFVFKSKEGQYPLPYILFNSKKYFVQSMEELFPDFITLAFSNLKKYEKKTNEHYSETARYEIIYTLLIHWDHLIPELYNQKDKVRLLIVSDFDVEHAKMIQDLLHRYLKHELTTTIYTDPIFSLKRLNNYAYDILITTFTLPFDGKIIDQSCICIRNVPTKRNIIDIAQAIENQYKLKKHPLKSILQKFIQL
ncbi:putative trans-acting regulator [Carnobacterium sp. 17-4]|uniref:M protein trans-acting positive regulator PRD domain-containing protein n=1 Tax=Carnobacterium sp. (strain 17-4) TaxID=208596 RepID=UPI0002058BFD|nr:M protein trans-acting positive regulator PRD domain-containing protein [Carnobacterium sp. 17-4]AEB30123.1 putative trans-acting regulator [Carnobacterium sp. 17-4]